MTAEKTECGKKVACKFCGKGSSVAKEFLIYHVLTVHPNEPEVKEWLKGAGKIIKSRG